MKKSEIFKIILEEVSEICEVRTETILGPSKYTSVVDSRILTVQYARRLGLTNEDIALYVLRMNAGDMKYNPTEKELRTKAKTVDNIFRSYSDRCLQSRAFVLMSCDMNKFIKEKFWD